MKVLTLALALAAAGLAASAQADDKEMEALAKKHNCLACHQTDKKVIGPAYKEVAKKYKGQKNAQTQLEQKVKKGGVGVWGQIPMPPNG
jgi:cytochrome c